MNFEVGKFTTSTFDVKIEHSLTLNYHSTPPSTLHRVTFDALQTPGSPDRCFGVHQFASSATTSPFGLSDASATTSPSGRSLVHVADYLLLA